jgi:hypothetical protein
MAQRQILQFLIKIGPVFFGLLWLWHSAGLSRLYHGILAGFLDVFLPPFDSVGIVDGVSAKGHDLLIWLKAGTSSTKLVINGEDITSNFAMLTALYLSSPIVRYWKLFLACFAGAVVLMFLLHALTVGSFVQQAFAGDPEIARMARYGRWHNHFQLYYGIFFEAMGMYLYALVLWIPYILHVIHDLRRREA